MYLATGNIAFINSGKPINEQVGRIKRLKNTLKPKQFCNLSNCEYFIDFAQAIYKLEFEEEPDYNFLRFLLAKNLLEQNTFPDNEFDWVIKMQ